MIFDSIVFDLPGKQSKESEGERGPAHTLLEPIVPYLDGHLPYICSNEMFDPMSRATSRSAWPTLFCLSCLIFLLSPKKSS